MGCLDNLSEIGCHESIRNLSKVGLSNSAIQEKVGASMPLPPDSVNVEERILKISEYLLSFKKTKYMFLLPEIAIIEKIAEISDDCEAIITIPCGIDKEVEQRIRNNTTKKMKVSILNEPFFLNDFFPSNGMIVVTGYSGMNHSMVLKDVYRLAKHYQDFQGLKTFIPYVELDTAVRYDGWVELESDYFSNINWRCTDENFCYNS